MARRTTPAPIVVSVNDRLRCADVESNASHVEMTNIYLKLIEEARGLPASFTAMGTRIESFDSTDEGPTVTGWHICEFANGKTPTTGRMSSTWWWISRANSGKLFRSAAL